MSACILCVAGSYFNLLTFDGPATSSVTVGCNLCRSGTYSSASGQTSCSSCNSSVCPLGQYRPGCETGATVDMDCVECVKQLPAKAYYTPPQFNVTTSYESRISYMALQCDSWNCFLGYTRSKMLETCVPCSAQPPLFAKFVPLSEALQISELIVLGGSTDDDPVTCSWACNVGYSVTNNGLCVKSVCPSNYYQRSSDGICKSCSSNVCGRAQYKWPCSANADGMCLNCSECPTGKFLVGCQNNKDQVCMDCTNKYEICYQINNSVSVYTGPGLLQSNCTWMCVEGYYRMGDMCRLCTIDACGIGKYRTACTPNADGSCKVCSGLPNYATFITAGSPYNQDNCEWTCNQGFYVSEKGNVSVCMECQPPNFCPKGQYIASCTKTENYKCVACAPVKWAIFTREGYCDFQCEEGYFKDGLGCTPCSQNLICADGQSLMNCTIDYDAQCTVCQVGVEYAMLVPGNSTPLCIPCTDSPCIEVGMYRGMCLSTADSECLKCTNGPVHSFYTLSGSIGLNNCTWDCNAGFEKSLDVGSNAQFCSICPAGSYSSQGDSHCTLCTPGTYSGRTGATRPDTCLKCPQGTYSTALQATSSHICTQCDVGTYQENPGSTACEPCPVDTYGTISAATDLSQCLACRSMDTSTRHRTGQKFKTACICKERYYRIDNETDQCQICPPGLECNGFADVLPVVNGSIWNIIHVQDKDYYRLEYCPQGYYYRDLDLTGFSAQNPETITVLSTQRCTVCDAGVDCAKPPCTSCSNCVPGKYKSCAGPQDCMECKVDTFEAGNGSLSCSLCPKGTTTNGLLGSNNDKQCVCDSKNYDLGSGEGCQLCPAGLRCFGNSTVIPVVLDVGNSQWSIEMDTEGIRKYNLTFCPTGYFVAGSISEPGKLECVLCPAGEECVDPPCYGACVSCKPGFWKSSSILYSQQVPRSYFDPKMGLYARQWIEEPCASCPVNTYRSLPGGTEVGSCTTCPVKSTTSGLLNRTSVDDCSCDIFYYAQMTSESSALVCSDCPQGAVCTSDRSCALGSLSSDTYQVGNMQTNLSCDSPGDRVFGGWLRNSTGEYRLQYCPPGFTLQRSEYTASVDRCNRCPTNTYLAETVYSPSVQCKSCPEGATCPGGDAVVPNPGFWKQSSGRRDGNTKVLVYKCPPGVCDDGGSCLNNRTGQVN
jgi:hypothetical protein